MAVHKLVINDFEDNESYTLVAIHSTLEDYRLAYTLNQALNLHLKKNSDDLDFLDASYSIFEWVDAKHLTTWNLVSNSCTIEEISNDTNTLFNNNKQIKSTSYYLVPEYKTVDYFLKINYQTRFFKEKIILDTLLSISHIVTAYIIQPKNLKTKTNLIFN